MYSADEIFDTAELDNIPTTIPDHHFTDIDIDDFEDVDEDGDGEHQTNDHGDDLETIDEDDYNNAPVYPMPFFRPDKPDETDEDLETNQDDEDLEPSDDFGGSFPLSVEYDDDLPEPTYIDDDDW